MHKVFTVEVLGSGGAFDPLPTSFLINETILVDLGLETVKKLIAEGKADRVRHILITHYHQDHVGGLELLTFYLVMKKITDVNIYTSASDFNRLFSVLDTKRFPSPYIIQDIDNMEMFAIGKTGILLSPFRVSHLEMNAYGFRLGKDECTLIFSGDTDSVIPVDSIPERSLLFHDMGMTGIDVPEHFPKAHPSENDVYNVYGPDERIIGIHTSSSLRHYKKAESGDLFFLL